MKSAALMAYTSSKPSRNWGMLGSWDWGEHTATEDLTHHDNLSCLISSSKTRNRKDLDDSRDEVIGLRETRDFENAVSLFRMFRVVSMI